MSEPSAPLSWRSPKAEVRQSRIHGNGVFAAEPFLKDEIVLVKGGHIVNGAQLREINARIGPVEIQIGPDLFIAPVTAQEREGSMLYTNHSCDPNLGVRGNVLFVAMRHILPGEELTHDWCMTDDDYYSVQCNCGSAKCRRLLTGQDWRIPELQLRYDGYFSSYLRQKLVLTAP